MGYGIVKLPKLLLAQRSKKIKMAWCLFSVSQYQELKMDKFNEILVLVCIMAEWKQKLAGKHDTIEEYNCIGQIEKVFE